MISIILLEPEHAGNIGAVARVMSNFGFEHLVVVDPKADPLDPEACKRAKHGLSVLRSARVIKKKELFSGFDTIIGTTAKTGTDYNIPRCPLQPETLAKKFGRKMRSKSNIGLLFGREGKGLTNPEVRMCDFIATIPASESYTTLNLSHAVAIFCYELCKGMPGKEDKTEYARAKEKEVLLNEIGLVLKKTEFSTPDKFETQKKVWKRVVGKAFLTKREAFALIGFFKKLK